ncbi:serine hydrolase [Caulobacter mirabilis]|uniref:beta-lactamase n=1 Tax=Caulobacter mirabilis TaxID=69666 RepID=A0A2D2B0H3_9CAUL|nr:serine hydrolase [Caulobacter mirabilis]ATQ43762.1 serine hydrolase [Caulobacter mirabilis]
MGRAARIVGRMVVGALALAAGLAAHPPFTYEPKFVVRPSPASRAPTAAERLDARLERMGRAFGGRIGIAVYNVDEGWAADFNGDALLPQQSVSKLWVSVATLDRVDRGELSLDDRVLIRKEDLSLFHQPIRAQVGEHGYVTTVRDLMRRAITQSDNAANDALIRRIGGPWAVQVTVVAKNLGEIRFGPGEREMQTAAAGLTWKPEYSFERHFWEDREALPRDVRSKALDAYVENPPDGASALDIAETLGRLKGGGLLSPGSTAFLLGLMAETSTGSSRLRASLAPGWTLQHKTGTGQVNGDLATGYNDVGLLTAPDGTAYAVAVLIGASRRPFKDRSSLIAEVGRAVIASHEAERGVVAVRPTEP